jgi:serine/threonine protein kinase
MAPNPLSFDLKPGTQPVPGYRLMKRIGRGGFGEVWEAQSTANESRIALKFLDTKNNAFTSLVVNEIKLLLQLRDLQHPNLLQFYSVSTGKNMIILSMELAEGSLNDLHYIYRTDNKTHLPPDVLLNLMYQSAEGLDFIARQKPPHASLASHGGMQHCDIKPSNLLLQGNVLKVADFGLSGPTMWNAKGTAFGTPPYAPPELYEGKSAATTDQYSLAVTYCELRTGQYPYAIPQPGNMPGTPDLTILPMAERPVVAKALSRQWLNRFSSCVEFAQALAAVVDPKGLPLTCSGRKTSMFRRIKR